MALTDNGQTTRIAIIAVCSLIFVGIVIAVVIGFTTNSPKGEPYRDNEDDDDDDGFQVSDSVKAVKSICRPTDFKQTCEEELLIEARNSAGVKELVEAAFKAGVKFATHAVENSTALRERTKDPRALLALENCKQLLTYSIFELHKSISKVDELDVGNIDRVLEDLKILLSATITNRQTCLDGFHNTTTTIFRGHMKDALNMSMRLSKIGLAITCELSDTLNQLQFQGVSRGLLGHADWSSLLDESPRERRLLQEKEPHVIGHMDSLLQENDPRKRRIIENDPSKLKPHVVVAEDGSGDFKTIEDAITLIPHNAQEPFVIYIKKGIYEENIIFNYNMTNIALIGDGKEKTRITGRLNYDDGLNTFNTATVAVHGDFFYAKNIGIENTAGAAKHQAVALMVISDFAVVYNCSINGHQNTLYVHSKRQFYRDCTVSGTIDFIFGDAASVFQNCKFVVRKPLEGQKNVVTAQGRSDERQPTGIVIQNSTIIADDDLVHLKNRYPTFLGRPLGNFSRTIIMETFIDDFIKPEGWTVGDDHRGLETSHFSEYNNRGPGSSTTGRVSWPAIKKLSPTTAHGFTPGKFFLGDDWIKAKGVPYTSGFSERQTRKLNMEVPSVLAADN
ncbi:pectinesterase-like [Hibiscus syriacus]|uniref:pectinesterase-like n=1 Tax=Hibiscus syriacus TaxID=106335 RepID=UPI001924BFD0|nr:pectinesterase-like [Hibiscus syriacus]